jgi:hypothetical protein
MQTTKPTRSLNQLTIECTAFQTWKDFERAMSDNHYVPSLYPHTGRGKAQKEWNEMVTELADRLESMGYSVYRGAK